MRVAYYPKLTGTAFLQESLKTHSVDEILEFVRNRAKTLRNQLLVDEKVDIKQSEALHVVCDRLGFESFPDFQSCLHIANRKG